MVGTRTEIAVVFEKFDTDGSGKISASELCNLCEELGYPLDDSALAEALQELDSNNNNQIDKVEFERWWNSEATSANKTLQHILKQAKLENAFGVHRASWDNDFVLLKRFLAENPSLATAVDETEFGLGYQPIHYAAYNGHLRIVKHLVEDCGVNFNARTKDGCTALFLAAQQDQIEVVQYLLESPKGSAKLNIGAKGFSPLDVSTDPNVISVLQKACQAVVPGLHFSSIECMCEKFGTLLIEWQYEPSKNPSQMSALTGYRVRLYTVPEDDSAELIKEFFVTGEDNSSFLVTAITAVDPVACSIAAENRTGVGDFSELSNAVRVIDRPSMDGISPKGYADSRSSISLSWEKAITNGAPVRSYIVLQREEDQEDFQKCATVDRSTRAVIDGLNPGTTYYFKIIAVNKAGRSDASDTSNAVRTQGGNAWNSTTKSRNAKNKLKAVLAFKGMSTLD